jgi:EmrB/QacA subfamily drug resistance transporter
MSSFPSSEGATVPDVVVVKRSYSGFWILVATILGSSMAFIDATAVSVALPILQSDLNASIGDLQWIINAYVLFLASLLLVGGALGDQLGRKRMFIAGIVIFAAASVWAGLSPNATSLIIARAVQGIGGAIFVPGSLALIGACFSDAERGSAIGTWSAASALTTVAGPVLGGFLAEEFSWRWVFFINIPVAVAVIAIAITRVPESRELTGSKIDWLGGALATTGLVGLVYGLTESANAGLGDPLVFASLSVGVAGLIGFVVAEAKVTNPMMPLGVFKNRSFSGANLLTLCLYAALGGFIFFLPLNLIQVQGYSATAAGLAMFPLMVLIATVSRWSGGLVVKVGAKIPLTVGPSLVGIGFLLFARPGIEGPGFSTYMTEYFPAVFLTGLGMAITVAPLVTVVMSTVDQRLSGLASGINNALSRTAMLLAVAVFGVVALGIFNASLDDNLIAFAASADVVEYLDGERTKLAGAVLPPGLGGEAAAAAQRAIDEAFIDAFRGVTYIGALLAFLSAFLAFFVIESHPKHGAQYES